MIRDIRRNGAQPKDTMHKAGVTLVTGMGVVIKDATTVELPKAETVANIYVARGGNVDRSYIDISVLKPTWKNRQVETSLSYTDLRKSGFKSIATLTTFMKEACQNALFFDALCKWWHRGFRIN